MLRSWAKTNHAPAEDGADLRNRKMVEAREKLERYCQSLFLSHVGFLVLTHERWKKNEDSFLLQVTEVMKIGKPEHRNLESLRRWLGSEQGGNHFLAGAGIEATAWEQKNFDDMVGLKHQSDRFAQWIMNAVIPSYHRRVGHWFHKKIDRDDLGDLWYYRDQTFVYIGNVVCILLSSLLPLCCIFALYSVQDTLGRLVLIACFNFVFSMAMTCIGQAQRQDIFAATTALAAVQVVFIGGIEIVFIARKGS